MKACSRNNQFSGQMLFKQALELLLISCKLETLKSLILQPSLLKEAFVSRFSYRQHLFKFNKHRICKQKFKMLKIFARKISCLMLNSKNSIILPKHSWVNFRLKLELKL